MFLQLKFPLGGLIALTLAFPPVITRLGAQAEVDSARVAREAWRQAAPLIRRQDWAGARAVVRRAFAAWPGQPVYANAHAALSARVRDTAETARALGHLADLGLTVDIAKDEARDRQRLECVVVSFGDFARRQS